MLAVLLVAGASAQTARVVFPKPGPTITGVRAVKESGVPAIEIVATQPVVPAIQMLDSPPRLVIDLVNTTLDMRRQRIKVEQGNILTIRAEQYQIQPAIVRIVVDLLVPMAYTWDAAGNRLMVRLKPPEDPNAARHTTPLPPKVPSQAPAPPPLIAAVANGVGNVVLVGKSFAVGSSLTAGADTMLLRLSRGGEVRICAGTTISVTPSKTKKDLMLGMSTGALETHYKLDASADAVLTPDFRILFAGPGEFHFAISADSHGNTCVRGLQGNTSSAIVSELMGDRVYQVKPDEQAVFRGGRIDKVDTNVPLECGCQPVTGVLRTDAAPVSIAPKNDAPKNDAPRNDAPKTLSSGPEIQPLPPSKPDDIHVQVDAPLVFNARQGHEAAPAPIKEVASLPVVDPSIRTLRLEAGQLEAQVQPPPPAQPRGFLGRVKGFFGSIFR